MGLPKRDMVTTGNPTPEDWFSAIAYARLDGGRQPKGCEKLWAITTEFGMFVGSFDDSISVFVDDRYVHRGYFNVGAARFGPPGIKIL